jgi:hypothetical protein
MDEATKAYAKHIIDRAIPKAKVRRSGYDLSVSTLGLSAQRAGLVLLEIPDDGVVTPELVGEWKRRFGDARRRALPFKVKRLSHRASWHGEEFSRELLRFSRAPHFERVAAPSEWQNSEEDLEAVGIDLARMAETALPARKATIDRLLHEIGGRIAYRRHTLPARRIDIETARDLTMVAMDFGAERQGRKWFVPLHSERGGSYVFEIDGDTVFGRLFQTGRHPQGDKENFHGVDARSFARALRAMGVFAPLSIQDRAALAVLGELEGPQWLAEQVADRESLSDPHGFFVNHAAFMALVDLPQADRSAIGLSAIAPGAGTIYGVGARHMYSVDPATGRISLSMAGPEAQAFFDKARRLGIEQEAPR